VNLRKDHKRKTRNVLRVHGLSRSRNDSKLQNKNPPLEKKSCGVRQPAGPDVYCVCVVDRIVFGVPRDLSVRDSFNTKKRKKRGARKCLRLSYYSSIFRSKEEKTRGAKVFAPLLLFLYIPIEGGKNEGRESVCASLTIPLYSDRRRKKRGARKCLRLSYYSSIFRRKKSDTFRVGIRRSDARWFKADTPYRN